MATSTVSRHVFRRNARKMERKLERERLQALADSTRQGILRPDLSTTHYRVAQRRGGLRWVVEKVTS